MALWERLDGETVKAFNAFKTYLRLGNKRSLAKTAEALGHAALGTVQNWSVKYKWVDRVAGYDEAEFDSIEGNRVRLMQANQEQILYDMMNDYNTMLDLWRRSLMNIEERLESDPLFILEAKEMKDLVGSRKAIDDIGRRMVGLPNSFLGVKDEKPKELPEMVVLPVPGAIRVSESSVDEDYEGDYDESDESE